MAGLLLDGLRLVPNQEDTQFMLMSEPNALGGRWVCTLNAALIELQLGLFCVGGGGPVAQLTFMLAAD